QPEQTLSSEKTNSFGQHSQFVQNVHCRNRLEYVEIEFRMLQHGLHSTIQSKQLQTAVYDGLRNDRIVLLCKERATFLHSGKRKLIETGFGTGGQQPEVLANLDQELRHMLDRR